MKFIFLPVLFFSSLCSAANDCPTGNFTKDFGVVRGSGGAEWCWANVTADLIGYTQGVKPPSRISAVDVAVSNLTISPEMIEETIKKLSSAGMESNRIPWYQGQTTAQQDSLKSLPINKITAVPSTALLSYQSRKGYCLESQLKIDYSSSSSYIAKYVQSVREKVKPQLEEDCKNGKSDAIKDVQIFNFELNQRILAQIESDMDKECNPRTEMKPMLPAGIDLNSDPKKRSATDFIKLGLNNGLPMAIGFDSALLSGKPYSKMQNHVGIITESRFNSNINQCEYLLRDSNGPDCSIYSKKIQRTCKDGHIWLSADEVNNSTQMIYAVDKNQ